MCPELVSYYFISTLWDNNFWLDLDFLDVAMAAQRCSAYFTSLLYIEIWHGSKWWGALFRNMCLYFSHAQFASDAAHHSPMEVVLEEDEAAIPTLSQTGLTGSASLEDPSVQQLLLEAYSNIGEPDSLYGVCAGKTSSKDTWLRLYEQEGHWERSLSKRRNILWIQKPRSFTV